MHNVAGFDFDTKVVDGAVVGVFDEREFEWGFGDREV
jgi:hypothetical protein